MKYELFIFDFDGTLADSYPWFSRNLNQAAEKFKFRKVRHDEQASLRKLHARQILKFLKISRWKLPRIINYMRKSMSRDIDGIELFEGVRELLWFLSDAGIKTGIVSSNNLSNVNSVLGGCADLIHFKECGTSLFGKPRKIKVLLRNSGVSAQRTLYLGDELRDIEAARETGLDICSVTWGYNKRDALVALQPTYTVDSFNDLFLLAERSLSQ